MMNKFLCFILVVFCCSCGDTAKKSDGKKNFPSCGDGVLNAGEKCDSGIASGEGACEESCAAPACSTATLLGSKETCDAECVVEPIACQNYDGCCPLGCDSQSDNDCSNTCGNDVVETPELCDGADCPDQCDSGDVCVTSNLKGEAQNCSARCELNAIETCVDGDGCCPSNCTSDNDSDCEAVSACGNGVVEVGEACDGNCPASCSDENACTTDKLVGAADTCSARCEFDPINTCVSNDGCCPSGCDEDNDNDCDPQCGNGVVDGGELCDGNCPSTCDDSKACTTDALVGSPSTCNSECSFTTISSCKNDDGCCPNNCEFANDNDCACVPDTCNGLGLVCGNHPDGCGGTLNCGTCTNGTCNNAGQCVVASNGDIGDACTDNTNCADFTGMGVGGTCFPDEPGGYCSSLCIPNFLPCPQGSFCVEEGGFNGNCRADCTSSNDCRTGYRCDLLLGAVCVPI